MRTETITLYEFDELPTEAAKERARDWFRQYVFTDSSDWEHVIEYAHQIAKRMGIEFDRREYETIGGKTRTEPAVYFGGFSSQGDGASFDGFYRYRKDCVKLVVEYAPKDAELHRIVLGLQEQQRRNFFKLTAVCKNDGRYCHSAYMDVEVERNGDAIHNPDVSRLLRDFANWIYRQLENEYEYQMSDESVEESLRANQYEFYEDGTRAV